MIIIYEIDTHTLHSLLARGLIISDYHSGQAEDTATIEIDVYTLLLHDAKGVTIYQNKKSFFIDGYAKFEVW